MNRLKISIFIFVFVVFTACNHNESKDPTNNVDLDLGKSACGSVAHDKNEERLQYLTTYALELDVCESEVQTRTCNDGVFDQWSGTYQYEACSVLTDITIESFEYQGGFRLSGGGFGDSSYPHLSYSPGVITYNPKNNSLFIVGHAYEQGIAEFVVPEIVNSRDMADFNVGDEVIQNFAPFHDTDRVDTGINGYFLVKGLSLIGEKLVVNYINWYDASGKETDTSVVFQDAANLATTDIVGPFQLEGAAHVAGWLTPIPDEWQGALGGSFVGGLSTGSIISRLSVGPPAFVLTPEDKLLKDKVGTEIETKPLLDFSLRNMLYDKSIYGDSYSDPDDILYNRDLKNDLWTINSGAIYGFIVPGTNTYVTLGRSGGHESGLGYKITQDTGYVCGGPCPFVADDHYNYYWLWHVSDLHKVKQGIMEPHDVRPYEYGKFDTPSRAGVTGASYDASSGLLYISLSKGDTTAEFSRPPLFYVYRIKQ